MYEQEGDAEEIPECRVSVSSEIYSASVRGINILLPLSERNSDDFAVVLPPLLFFPLVAELLSTNRVILSLLGSSRAPILYDFQFALAKISGFSFRADKSSSLVDK